MGRYWKVRRLEFEEGCGYWGCASTAEKHNTNIQLDTELRVSFGMRDEGS